MNISGLFNFAVWGTLFLILIFKFLRSIRLVPTRSAYVVERLGRYHSTLRAGFHALVPFLDVVVKIVDLKEETIDVPPQECFTGDEVMVQVDGVLYIQASDAERAVYGITNYRFAAVQLAQTTTRSVIGTLDLDRTFEERDLISSRVVEVLNQAGAAWGIQVHRYEIKNIAPPVSVRDAMERQVTAERDRKAVVARAEGDRQSAVNRSEGNKVELINESEGEMQRRINEAEGKAAEIRAVADATADSIEKIADAIMASGGAEAVKLRLTQKFINELGALQNPETGVLLPANLLDIDSLLASLKLGSGESS